jgi:hypothetical protein
MLHPDRCVVLEGRLTRDRTGNPQDQFVHALTKVMEQFHNAHSNGAAGPTFGKVAAGGVRMASGIHVRLFADGKGCNVRATVFRLGDERVKSLLKSWADRLDLKPVWGNPWF